MTYLSHYLKTYYTRHGNKVLFLGTMTLNELALKMWERLNYHKIDASIVSKVINGTMLFNADQLRVFCEILKISDHEKEYIKKNLIRDILEEKGLQPLEIDSDYQLLYVDTNIPVLHKLRLLGQPHETIKLSELLRYELQLRLRRDRTNKELKRSIGKLYSEESRAYAEIASYKSLIQSLYMTSRRAIHIGEELNDQELVEKSYITHGGVYYLTGEWKKSADYFENKYNAVTKTTQIEFLRTLLLCYSKLKNYSKYREIFTKAIDKIEKYSDVEKESVCSLIESMSRSLLAFGMVYEAKKLLTSNENAKMNPFYKAQMIRCKTQILYKEFLKYKTVEKEEIKQCGNEIFEEKYANFGRHKQQINTILEKL